MQEQETIHAVMAPLDDDSIKSRILTIRGVQVILDRDIAFLYGVETKVLNQAVKRNRERFPDRFMFQLTEEELGNWKSQIVTSNPSLEQTIKMGVRRAPYAFTEQGVAMLSAVLKSETAIRVSIQIMDAFSAMRRALASIAPILSRLDVVERRQITDQQRNEERQALRRIFIREETGPQGEEEPRPRGQLLRRCHARHPFAKMRRCGCADCHHAQVGHQVHIADRRRQVQQAESDAYDQGRWFIPR